MEFLFLAHKQPSQSSCAPFRVWSSVWMWRFWARVSRASRCQASTHREKAQKRVWRPRLATPSYSGGFTWDALSGWPSHRGRAGSSWDVPHRGHRRTVSTKCQAGEEPVWEPKCKTPPLTNEPFLLACFVPRKDLGGAGELQLEIGSSWGV